MPSERDEFLAAIQANWTDCELRAIYADWLEERGEVEAAAEQRGWAAKLEESRRYMEKFAQRLGGVEHYDEEPAPALSVDMLLAAADNYANPDGDTQNLYLYMGTNENYKDFVYGGDEMDKFWQHYYVLTGRTCSDGGSFFSCSC